MTTLAAAVRELHSALDSTRNRIAEIDGEILEAEGAPLPLAAAKTRIEAWIADRASTWQPQIGHLATHDHRDTATPALLVTSDKREIEAMMCAIAPQQVAAAMERAVQEVTYAQAAGKPMPASARAALLKKLKAERRALELGEENLTRQAEAAGLAIPRRPDVSPEVALLTDAALAEELERATKGETS